MKMFFVYILQSVDHPNKYYVGSTSDLETRLEQHNSGISTHTAKFQPWKIAASVAVGSREVAEDLESYFKKGSGHAFWKKRLLSSSPSKPQP
jgi:putative endonuclease